MKKRIVNLLGPFLPVLFQVALYAGTEVGGAPGSSPEANELYRSYKRSLQHFGPVEFRVETDIFVENCFGRTERGLMERTKWLCRVDGARSYFRGGEVSYDNAGAVLERHGYEEMIRASGWLRVDRDLELESDPGTSVEAENAASPGRLTPGNRVTFGLADPGLLVLGYAQSGMPRSSWLPDLLGESVLSRRTGIDAGTPLEILEARGPYGYYELALEPTRGYLPRWIKYVKQGEDRAAADRIRDIPGCLEFTFLADAFEIKSIEDRYAVTAFKTRMDHKYADRTEVIHYESRLSDYNFHPGFTEASFEPAKPIPDGQYVQADDERGIIYKWSGGRPVKFIDRGGLGLLRGHSFASDRSNLLYMFIGGIALVLLGLWAVRSIGKNAKAS